MGFFDDFVSGLSGLGDFLFGTPAGEVVVPSIDKKSYIPADYTPNYNQYSAYNSALLDELSRRANLENNAQLQRINQNLAARGLNNSNIGAYYQTQAAQTQQNALMNALDQQKAQQFTTEQNKAWQNRSAQEKARQNLQNMLFNAQMQANQTNAQAQYSPGLVGTIAPAVGTIAGAAIGGAPGAALGGTLGKLFSKPSPYQLDMSNFPTGNLGGY